MLTSNHKAKLLFCTIAIVALSLMNACAGAPEPTTTPKPVPVPETKRTRAEAIPANANKMTPESDTIPPNLHSTEFQDPVPLGSAINTAGGEDSAFIMPDGKTLYFFFTPDVTIPAEKQLLDGLTGIWVARKQDGQWSQAERVVLQDKNELALDGCVFVQDDEMWFCSARKSNYRGVDMWTAEFKNGRWTNWKNSGKKLNLDFQMGELHITSDGSEIYFHSSRAGGKGQYDIWVTKKVNGEWQEPVNVEAVNTAETEGWPFITQDGSELWFLRTYMGSPGIFRSKKAGGQWGKPELIVSQFAAEPSLDSDGNLYFTHHFIKDGKMIEADIYVAYRKQ